jgi:hypothetical protein
MLACQLLVLSGFGVRGLEGCAEFLGGGFRVRLRLVDGVPGGS